MKPTSASIRSVRTRMRGFTSDELTEEQQTGMVRREARSISPYGNVAEA